MKTYRQILNELFDSKIDVEVLASTHRKYNATFEIETDDDMTMDYVFQAVKYTTIENASVSQWQLSFFRKIGPSASLFDAQNDLTKGETLQVFSGIKTAMLMFMKKYNPERISFSAKSSESSRVKLYKKFAKMIAKKFKFDLLTGSDDGEEIFDFKRSN